MLRVNQKEITSIYAPVEVEGGIQAKPVSAVYRYGKLIWQAISSCFGRGY